MEKKNKRLFILLPILITIIYLYINSPQIKIVKSAKNLLENDAYNHKMLVSININKEDLEKMGLDESLESTSIITNNYVNKETNEFYQEGTFLNGRVNLDASRYYSNDQALIKEPTFHKYVRFKDYENLSLKNSSTISSDAILHYLSENKLKNVKKQTIYDIEVDRSLIKVTYVVDKADYMEFTDTVKTSILNNIQYENLIREYILIKNKLTKSGKADNEVMLETGLIVDNLNATLENLINKGVIQDIKMELIIDEEILKELEITANLKLGNGLDAEFNMNLGFNELENGKMLGRTLRIDDFSIMNYENMRDSVDYFENENLRIENIITPVIETNIENDEQEEVGQW